MRAKQVTALMMAATLAVTGNGVTAFAEPVANVEAGDAATDQGIQHTPLLPRLCYGTYYNCIFCGCQAGTQKFHRYFSN